MNCSDTLACVLSSSFNLSEILKRSTSVISHFGQPGHTTYSHHEVSWINTHEWAIGSWLDSLWLMTVIHTVLERSSCRNRSADVAYFSVLFPISYWVCAWSRYCCAEPITVTTNSQRCAWELLHQEQSSTCTQQPEKRMRTLAPRAVIHLHPRIQITWITLMSYLEKDFHSLNSLLLICRFYFDFPFKAVCNIFIFHLNLL